MQPLLAFSRGVDRVNTFFGSVATWLVLISCVISAGNASIRYLISSSSNAWLEIQWYMFSGIFLLGASYTLKVNEHVRVDVFYSIISERARLWVDAIGIAVFLLPATTLLAYMNWPFFVESWNIQEGSSNAGGLIRWPVKILPPIGFALLTLQGFSELIKRVAALMGIQAIETKYEKPLQ